eukprot:CAMPEP_0197395828 /NCGR_PEP_ID=MMETSP1165-20131217/7554_1 /TAXON_ID=284809 /ORGANISM="Chrysocystis fragilis, Strain CCMP3189" /LENGTH=51 /DNA_ID=CAMNT_0042921609 /DNA_START=83 /DNA_END=235 /DNA_ORIENTATION=+
MRGGPRLSDAPGRACAEGRTTTSSYRIRLDQVGDVLRLGHGVLDVEDVADR